jgi:hypothetical protein
MLDIEVIAINGLDSAIIGTTVRNGREVLAYDYDKAVQIIVQSGRDIEYAEKFIEEAARYHEEGGPAFVYLDVQEDIYDIFPPEGVTVH